MSNLPDYSEITRLRLRLAEVELQRDAFKAMADKAVTDLIRQVMDRERWQVGLPGVTTYVYDQTQCVNGLDDPIIPKEVRRPKKPAKRKRRG
jgi:hypothetical protein